MLTGYGRTAARKHGPLGRDVRPQAATIDIHSHVSVPEAATEVAGHLDLSANPLARFSTRDTKASNAQQEFDRRSRMTGHGVGLSERLRDLDDVGIDIQVVMPPPPQCYYTVPIEISVKASQVVNNGMAEYAARKPDRFIARRKWTA